MVHEPKKIGLLVHTGNGNLGDNSTLTAVMSSIRSRWPAVIFYGFSMNPGDTELRHGIPAYALRREWVGIPAYAKRREWTTRPQRGAEGVGAAAKPRRWVPFRGVLRTARNVLIRWPRAALAETMFLAKSFRVVRPIDILIISGGGQLLDTWGGPWRFPWTIFKWVLLAKLSGAKCFCLSVGAGPLTYPLSKFFVRQALRLADYVSFRDGKSQRLVQQIGFRGKSRVFPDCVYALDASDASPGVRDPRNRPVVGMSPMAYCDPTRYWDQDRERYETFTSKMIAAGARLTRQYDVALFTTDIWFNSTTLDKVDAGIQAETGESVSRLGIHRAITDVRTLLGEMSKLDYVITCRYHGVVFAHLMNKPLIALSHHPKVATLMAELGLSEYCLDMESFEAEQLEEKFTKLVANANTIKARMAEQATRYKAELTEQFDQLFAIEAVA